METNHVHALLIPWSHERQVLPGLKTAGELEDCRGGLSKGSGSGDEERWGGVRNITGERIGFNDCGRHQKREDKDGSRFLPWEAGSVGCCLLGQSL